MDLHKSDEDEISQLKFSKFSGILLRPENIRVPTKNVQFKKTSKTNPPRTLIHFSRSPGPPATKGHFTGAEMMPQATAHFPSVGEPQKVAAGTKARPTAPPIQAPHFMPFLATNFRCFSDLFTRKSLREKNMWISVCRRARSIMQYNAV